MKPQTDVALPILNYAVGTLVALFPIANPIGAVPAFYSLTGSDSRTDRRKQAQRTALNVVLILALFLFAGRTVLEFFGISLNVLRIAGGLLVAHAAWEMVTSKQRMTDSEHQAAVEKEDVSFTPMAIPLIAGPGSIGVVIGLATKMTQWSEYLGCLIGIILFGGLLYLCLALGETLLSRMGHNGFGALNRVFGFFILAIAVQLMADGVISLFQTAAPTLFR
ncbi:MarC family protein [Phormidesmis priestleyi]|uniref:MarC family protein n=1 Tax=Phormidesmis priestleyi TaxID=268141 RepID=UPI00083B10F4|nr:MarC family protein [Phormidesmis priestleyi]